MDLSIELNDDPEILSIFGQLWQSWDGSEGSTRKIVSEILKHNRLWQSDLTKFQGLEELTTKYVLDIQNLGMSKALRLQDFEQCPCTEETPNKFGFLVSGLNFLSKTINVT